MKRAGLLDVVLVVVLVVAFGIVVAFEQEFRGFQTFILGWRGIGFGVVVVTIYFVARRAAARALL